MNELAGVLSMDIVGFSKHTIEEQYQQARELSDALRKTKVFKEAGFADDLVATSTGDGAAIVFFRRPFAPIECAVELAATLQARSDLKLRMGIHFGDVKRVASATGHNNVIGDAMNMAQRVMDYGDAGQILLSDRYADFLKTEVRWATHLYQLGECEFKHGIRLVLYNYYDGNVGNPAVPARMSTAIVHPTVPLEATKATKGRILIVNENRLELDTLLAMIQSAYLDEQCNVVTAGSATEAISLIEEQEPFDIVMTEMRFLADKEYMEAEDVVGLKVVEAARKKGDLVQIIVVTAYGSLDSVFKALELGASQYIDKKIPEFNRRLLTVIETRLEYVKQLRKRVLSAPA